VAAVERWLDQVPAECPAECLAPIRVRWLDQIRVRCNRVPALACLARLLEWPEVVSLKLARICRKADRTWVG